MRDEENWVEQIPQFIKRMFGNNTEYFTNIHNFRQIDEISVGFDIEIFAKKGFFTSDVVDTIKDYFVKDNEFENDLMRKFPDITDVVFDEPYISDNEIMYIKDVEVYF